MDTLVTLGEQGGQVRIEMLAAHRPFIAAITHRLGGRYEQGACSAPLPAGQAAVELARERFPVVHDRRPDAPPPHMPSMC